ncbi:MAG TPA: thermonuclease family protein [Alphaproteobacteria bacterium]|nr:thermonuclease family protein [Alphaproteobacteria bacterium]
MKKKNMPGFRRADADAIANPMIFLHSMRLFLLFLGLVCLIAPARAAAPPAFAVAGATSGAELALADGRTAKLDGIAAPLPATAALARQARDALQSLIGKQSVMLEDSSVDRYGRIAAQVYVIDAKGGKIWLQGAMLKSGLVFVYPPTGKEARLADMLKLEAKARAAKAGIWADAFYVDVPAAEAWQAEGRFAFVRGMVVHAARGRGKIYLDFDKDWKKERRRAFTAVIEGSAWRAFRKAGVDPLAYEGRMVRVRGWIMRDPGPSITVADPGQIEIISAQ